MSETRTSSGSAETPLLPQHSRPLPSLSLFITLRHAAQFIDDDEVIEKILRHLELWPEQGGVASPSRAPPRPDDGERIVELCFDDPFPDYDTEPVMAYANDPDFAA